MSNEYKEIRALTREEILDNIAQAETGLEVAQKVLDKWQKELVDFDRQIEADWHERGLQ